VGSIVLTSAACSADGNETVTTTVAPAGSGFANSPPPHPVDDLAEVTDRFVSQFASLDFYDWGRSVRGDGDVVPAAGRGDLVAVLWSRSLDDPAEFSPTIDDLEFLTTCDVGCEESVESLRLDDTTPVVLREVVQIAVERNLSVFEVIDGDVEPLAANPLRDALEPIESEREAFLVMETPAFGIGARRPVHSWQLGGEWYVLTARGDDVLCHPTGLTMELWRVGVDGSFEQVDSSRHELRSNSCP